MLNMKKGLALVLAAATAFTFAPVSTLGLTGVVEAKAATGQLISSTNDVTLSVGDYTAIPFNDLVSLTGQNWNGLNVSVADDSTATIGLSLKRTRGAVTNAHGTSSNNGNLTGQLNESIENAAAKEFDVTKLDYHKSTGDNDADTLSNGTTNIADINGGLYLIVQAGTKAGETTITLTSQNQQSGDKKTDTIHVTVIGSNYYFSGLKEVDFNKTGKNSFETADAAKTATKTISATSDFDVENYTGSDDPVDTQYRIEAQSSNEDVATTATNVPGESIDAIAGTATVPTGQTGTTAATVDATVKNGTYTYHAAVAARAAGWYNDAGTAVTSITLASGYTPQAGDKISVSSNAVTSITGSASDASKITAVTAADGDYTYSDAIASRTAGWYDTSERPVAGTITPVGSPADGDKITVTGHKDSSTTKTSLTAAKGTQLVITPAGAGESTVTLNFIRTINGKDTIMATGNFVVKVKDLTDTLSVTYDSNRDSVNETYSIDTVADDKETGSSRALASDYAAQTFEKDASDTVLVRRKLSDGKIVLDTTAHTTSKIATSDSLGRVIKYSSDNAAFSVDNSGNVTIDKDNATTGSSAVKSGHIVVSVDKVVANSHTIAGLQIVIPVTVYNKEAESLTVSKESGEILGQSVGTANVLNPTAFGELPTLYLSTKDKKTATLKISSASGASYVQGVVTAVSDSGLLNETQSTDVVTYDNATQTLTAGNKAGKAEVTITARNDANHYGNAVVKFGVEVVTKSANNVINAPETISLSATNRTASIEAKASVASTPLTYDIVKAYGSNEAAKSSDISVDSTGKVTYSGSNTGKAYVRIQGAATSEAVRPDAAFVTVSYNSSKADSTLAVSNRELNLKPGDTQKINATVSGSAVISYKSSNEDVATVAQDGTVTAKAAGFALVTVSTPEDDAHSAGSQIVTVLVSQNGEVVEPVNPEAVANVKVKNTRGAKVKVTWTAQDPTILYRVYKKVGNGSWKAKNVTDPKATLQVKKGATVTVKVKAFRRDKNGKAVWGPKATKAKAFKTDKK